MQVKIKPIKVVVFPEDVYARYISLSAINVLPVDKGVDLYYNFLTDEGVLVGRDNYLKLENNELTGWTNTDEQLIDIILNKLGLERETDEPEN